MDSLSLSYPSLIIIVEGYRRTLVLWRTNILIRIRNIQSSQLEEDIKSDVEDLRQVLKSVLLTGSDADLFNCLEIVREELSEALKTLQRTCKTTQKDGDTFHQKFIESGIDALRRLSANVVNLPNWTITKYEITIEHIVLDSHISHLQRNMERSCSRNQSFV